MSDKIARNNALYPGVVTKDPAAIEAMILNNLGLVVVKVDAFISNVPGVAYLRDDLVSAGNVGLVKAVKKIDRRVRIEAVNLWLARFIVREMHTVLPSERTILLPRPSKMPQNDGRSMEPATIFNALPETLEAPSGLRVIELRDTIEACCESEAERECLRLREEGYTFTEISDMLSIPLVGVKRMFDRLKARVLGHWTNPRDVAPWRAFHQARARSKALKQR
jgi:DNA-directed RNA polymerase specialized sigma24 family protein